MSKKPTKSERKHMDDLIETKRLCIAEVYKASKLDTVPFNVCFLKASDEVQAAYIRSDENLRQFEQYMVAKGKGYYMMGAGTFRWSE